MKLSRNVVSIALFVLTAIGIARAQVTHQVDVFDSFFSPASVTIDVGDTVQWNWKGPFMAHTVTSGVSSACAGAGTLFDASSDPVNPTFSFTFNNAGKVDYFCRPHEFAGMSGVVLVRGLTLNGTPAAGQPVNFTASNLGPADEGGKALVLLSISGTSPGIPLGCTGTVDIKQDAITQLGLSLAAFLTTSVITGGTGSTPVIPMPSNTPVGITLFYAAVVINIPNFGAILPTESVVTQ